MLATRDLLSELREEGLMLAGVEADRVDQLGDLIEGHQSGCDTLVDAAARVG